MYAVSALILSIYHCPPEVLRNFATFGVVLQVLKAYLSEIVKFLWLCFKVVWMT